MPRYSEGSTAAPPKALQPPPTSGDGQAGIHPPPSVAFSTDFTEPANNADLGECRRITIDTRNAADYISPVSFAGIDTVHLRIIAFQIADNNALKVHTEIDSTTGQTKGYPLYSTSHGVVEGTKAFFNHPGGLFRITIRAHGEAYVNVSLPKVLYGENSKEINTLDQLHRALSALESLLMEVGMWADLQDPDATVTRLDLARTVTLPDKVPVYTDVIRSLNYPRTEATNYKSGARWSNGSRQLSLYDKGKEKGEGDSKECRLEYRMTKGRTVEGTVGTKRVQDVLQPSTFSHLSEVYVDATGKLLSADTLPDVSPTSEGIEAVVEALKDTRAGYKKALIAVALARFSTAEREAFFQAVKTHFNRQTAYRVKQQLENLRCYADLFSASTRTHSDLYAELKKAFTTQTN